MNQNNRERRIVLALEGAACTGKTTLIQALMTAYAKDDRVVFVEEAAREYLTKHPTPLKEVFSTRVQAAIQAEILKKEKTAHELQPTVIICDRSVIDSPIHVEAFGNQADADHLTENVADWLITYYLFLLLDPADVPFENDDIRKDSPEDRNLVHATFLRYFAKHELPFILLSGSVEERMARVKLIVDQFL